MKSLCSSMSTCHVVLQTTKNLEALLTIRCVGTKGNTSNMNLLPDVLGVKILQCSSADSRSSTSPHLSIQGEFLWLVSVEEVVVIVTETKVHSQPSLSYLHSVVLVRTSTYQLLPSPPTHQLSSSGSLHLAPGLCPIHPSSVLPPRVVEEQTAVREQVTVDHLIPSFESQLHVLALDRSDDL